MQEGDTDEEADDGEDWDLLVRAWRGRQNAHPGGIACRREPRGRPDGTGESFETPMEGIGR